MKLSTGYPHRDDERLMLADAIGSTPQSLSHSAILEPGQLNRVQGAVSHVSVIEVVQDYLVRLAEASRRHPEIALGLSPRGLLTWQRMAQAWAFLDGRAFVTPNDVQDVAMPVLVVRLGIDRDEPRSVIQDLLEQVEVPTSA